MGESTLTTAGRPAGSDELADRAHALQLAVYARILSADPADPDSAVRHFATGLGRINDRLAVLERATRSVVYGLNMRALFDPLRREREPDLHSRARGILGHSMTNPNGHLSLVAAASPDMWVAPVRTTGIVVDERLGLFPGPPGPAGEATAWLCRDEDLIAQFCELWWATKRQAVPIHDVPGVVPLSERQLAVAGLLSQGAKDATIARRLGVSLRTVSNDVGRLLDSFGVGTRWEAGMVLGRACPPELLA
ncbi:helix-turn-helix transcriptional regulator [Micromonospora auratinigra]|uniref:Regulatory protein, luxR family n=1 Tax=Micromonospora auratinigra TaxID=261654 RepID=A0A1A8ZPA4_9ACTN|nr:helix-turn-helix transcriptional regulator [Micromonospora auratinigra]SBT45693.1 regulatory protein, luxR family [Micromonospora auratinigra]